MCLLFKMNWNFWTRPFSSFVFLWMALGLLCLTVLVIAGAFVSRERIIWVSQTIEVLLQLERYEANVIFSQNMATAEEAVDRLLSLTADNPGQSARVQFLKSLTEQLIRRLEEQKRVPPLIGRPLQSISDDLPIEGTIKEIRREERDLLAQRQNQSQTADRTFSILMTVVLVTNLLIVWWAYQASRLYLMERNQMDVEIRALNTRLADQVTAISGLNASLENRVAEKTRQLEATIAKLQASNLELERFAYVASHDMQEPLRQVASFNNLLAVKYADQLDFTAKRYLEYSVAGAKRLQLMLRGLLQYTITTPAAVYRSEIPVESMMQAVLQGLQKEIEETSAVIHVDAPAGLCIVGDRDMLVNLATALISNAIKFRRFDQTPLVSVVFTRVASQWSLMVTDNGIGVEERFMPRMFDMFSRFHPVGEHEGAGVGLALSKRIVDCHNGEVVVSAAPGGGTVFSVDIPILSKDHQNGLERGDFRIKMVY